MANCQVARLISTCSRKITATYTVGSHWDMCDGSVWIKGASRCFDSNLRLYCGDVVSQSINGGNLGGLHLKILAFKFLRSLSLSFQHCDSILFIVWSNVDQISEIASQRKEVDDEKRKRTTPWKRLGMDFDLKQSILTSEEDVDKYLMRHHDQWLGWSFALPRRMWKWYLPLGVCTSIPRSWHWGFRCVWPYLFEVCWVL